MAKAKSIRSPIANSTAKPARSPRGCKRWKLTGERALLLYPAGLDFIAAFFRLSVRRRGRGAGLSAAAEPHPAAHSGDRRRCRSQDRPDDSTKSTNASQTVLDETPDLQKLPGCAPTTPHGAESRLASGPTCMATRWRFCNTRRGSTGTPKGVMLTHANLMHNSALDRLCVRAYAQRRAACSGCPAITTWG